MADPKTDTTKTVTDPDPLDKIIEVADYHYDRMERQSDAVLEGNMSASKQIAALKEARVMQSALNTIRRLAAKARQPALS